ncbi:MAG: hypothetical protein HZC28_04185 [Spirochaetes bacterium]|nr:hypothetical protein [Spirochaetota bacterium]
MTATVERTEVADGIHAIVPYDMMSPGARKMRDFYDMKPGAAFYQREFGFYSLEAWKTQGMPQDIPHHTLFGFDPAGKHSLGQIGWCEAGFNPVFEDKILEDRGDYEVVQDFAGRHVLCFKGRRSGFMPEYIDHPVKDMRTWKELCEWRLNPSSPERYADLDKRMANAQRAAGEGQVICQNLVGGYMYLRSLMGPEGILYKVYDDPELIHACMRTWFILADAVIARHQEYVTLDEIYFGEDICYNAGPLIGPDMIREFLFPYYQQLITNAKHRQLDPDRHLFVNLDTDGKAATVIEVYQEIGMDYMNPFEVASGCDVVEVRKKYPSLLMHGGFDKRILAKGKEAIDREVDRIFPFMKKYGGYMPTCDHGVPEEVKYEDYLHYRKRCLEF